MTMRSPSKLVVPLAAVLFVMGPLALRPVRAEEGADSKPTTEEGPKDSKAQEPREDEKRLEETRKEVRDAAGDKAKADLKGDELRLDIKKEDWDRLSQKQRDALAKKLRKTWKGSGRKVKLPGYMERPSRGSGKSREGGEEAAGPSPESAALEGLQRRLPGDLRDSPAAQKLFDGSTFGRAAAAARQPGRAGMSPVGIGGGGALPVFASDKRLNGRPYDSPSFSKAPLPEGFKSFAQAPPLPSSSGQPRAAAAPEGSGAGRYDALIRAAVGDKSLGLKHVDGPALRAFLEAKNPSWSKGAPPDEARARAERRLVKGGSYGLLLVSPEAARWAGVKGDLRDPETNIRAGAKVLDKLTDVLGGDLHRGLAAYQAGLGAVRRSGGIPQREDVRALMSGYERAYRAPAEDGAKPPVKSVEAPPAGHLRRASAQLAESARSALAGTPPIGDDRPKYNIPSKVDPYMDRARELAAKAGVDPRIAQAVMYAEMGHLGKPAFCNGYGACGLMQIKPSTMREMVGLGYLSKPVSVRTAEGNIEAGVSYLKYLQDRFGDRPALIAAAYNAGPNRASLDRGLVPRIGETEEYVAKVAYWMYANYGERLPYGDSMRPDSRRRADAEWRRLADVYGYY